MVLLQRLKERWAGSTLLRRLSVLSFATAVAQGLQMFHLLLLAKLYSLPQVGEYVVLFTVVGIVAPIVFLCYETLIPSIADSDLSAYMQGVLFLLFPSLAAVYFLGWALGYEHAWGLVVWVAGVAIHRFGEMQNIRANRFRLIGWFRFFFAAGGPVALLILLFLNSNQLRELIALQAWICLLIGACYAAISTPRSAFRLVRGLRGAINELRHGANAPKFLVLSSFLNLMAFNLPVLIIEGWFGPGAAAQYAYVLRFGFGPVSLIGGALYQVFYGYLSEAIRTDSHKMQAQFLRVRIKVGFVACIVACVIAVLYPMGFKYILGDDWLDAGWMAVIYSPFFAVMLYLTPLTVVLNVFSRQKIELKSQAHYFLLSVFSFSLAILLDSLWIGIVLFSLLGSLRYMLLLKDINGILAEKILVK
jgi:O-antigen/teichoic acid export membrane protein